MDAVWIGIAAHGERAVARLEGWLEQRERGLGVWGVAALVATALLALGALYVRPALEAVSHGVYYAELSRAPFAPGDNPVAYRILTPLLAWALGLRGNRILLLNLAFAWATLALVYWHYRASGRPAALALGYAALLATTMPTLFTIFFNGYTDAVSYLLLFVLVARGRKPWQFGLLVLLSLLNRESVAFMLPFLLLLQWRRGADLRRSLLATALALVAYLGVRYVLGRQATNGYSMAFYLTPLLRDPLHWLRKAGAAYSTGVFSAFKLLWLLPLAGAMWAACSRCWWDVALLVSAVGGALAQTVIAVDTSRMLCMAFPAVLLGAELLEPWLRERRGQAGLLALVVLNLGVPQLYAANNRIWMMQTLLGYVLTR